MSAGVARAEYVATHGSFYPANSGGFAFDRCVRVGREETLILQHLAIVVMLPTPAAEQPWSDFRAATMRDTHALTKGSQLQIEIDGRLRVLQLPAYVALGDPFRVFHMRPRPRRRRGFDGYWLMHGIHLSPGSDYRVILRFDGDAPEITTPGLWIGVVISGQQWSGRP